MKAYRLYFYQYSDYGNTGNTVGYYSSIEKAADKAKELTDRYFALHQNCDIIIAKKSTNPFRTYDCYTLDGKETEYTYFGHVIEEIEIE